MGNVRNIKSSKVPKKISRDTVQLWRFSQEIDEVLSRAIVETHLAPEDVAAVLAHRLGTLITMSDDPVVLTQFCQKLLERLSAS